MGKFSRNSREYSFASLEEMISDVIQEYNDKNDITIVLSYDEVPSFITALISTGKFTPQVLDWAYPEINGYEKEYSISIMNLDGGEIYLEKCWMEDKNMYYNDIGIVDVCFVSQSISKTLYDKISDDGDNVILFDIAD